MPLEKIAIFWSGGKDSALALYKILIEDKYQVAYLITTINEPLKRISMHGVREELLEAQSNSIGIPLLKMYVNEASNAAYEIQMQAIYKKLKSEKIYKVVFGDIFLEDLKKYREEQLSKSGMQGIYPLWKKGTKELITEFLALGFKTIVCCVNDAHLKDTDAGQEINTDFINNLPKSVDPCGENGEYHTFCFDGPIFKYPITCKIGEKIHKPLSINFTNEDSCLTTEVETKGFWFCDLLIVY